MDSTLALAITRVILEEMNKASVVDEATKPTKPTNKQQRQKVTVKKQEKKINGDNSNC